MSRIIVIGGGIVGASAAYRLARAGAEVVLVDREDIGQATAVGAGIIDPGTSHRAPEAFYPLSARAVGYYPSLLAELAEDGEEETGYEVVGSLFVAMDGDEAQRLEDLRRLAVQRRDSGVQGIGDVSTLDPPGARGLFPPLGDVTAAIHVSGAARVNGRLLRDALRRAATKRGATIRAGAARVAVAGDRIARVEVDGEGVPADAVIVAAGAWSKAADLGALHIPVHPQRGQILHLDMPGADTSRWPILLGFDPHYLLTFPPSRVVAGATREDGAGYDPRVTVAGACEVTSEALHVAPGLAVGTLLEIRVGLRPASPDGLPILGPVPGVDGAYVATGHGPSGLQLGPYSGAVVADLALGRTVDLDLTPYALNRFNVSVR